MLVAQFVDLISEPLSLIGLAQSSTDGGQDAALATDADSITCSQTLMELGAWWAGDIGREAHVRFVHLDPDDLTGKPVNT